ncbi:hypothetical protein HUS23_02865 [Ectothiorhodospiraceae bacterium 2226]|nr:hypothetical protein HUS23_02865 [Ectothiorhodospiraceae bacterium 2226]
MSTSVSVVLDYPALGYIVGRAHAADDEGFEMTSVPVHLPRGARVCAALVARGWSSRAWRRWHTRALTV